MHKFMHSIFVRGATIYQSIGSRDTVSVGCLFDELTGSLIIYSDASLPFFAHYLPNVAPL